MPAAIAPRAVQSRAPDVVHTHGVRADMFAALGLQHVPTLTTLHTNPRRDYTELYGQYPGNIVARIHL